MQPLTKNMLEQKRNLPVVCAFFFSIFYLFILLCIEPDLVYHNFEITHRAPFFKTGWLFLQDCLSYPGGPSQYLAAFLTQLCYFPWIGALSITLIAWGIYRFTAALTAIASDSPLRVICYVPAILILMICGRYENPLSISTALLVVLFFSVLYEKLSLRLDRARAILFLIFAGVLYYVTGSTTFVFIIIAALCELFKRRKLVLGGLYLLLGLVVCYLLGAFVFNLEAAEIYSYSNPFVQIKQNLEKEKWPRLFEMALFVFLPAVVLFINVSRRLTELRNTSHRLRRGPKKKSLVTQKTSDSMPTWVVQTVLLALIAVPSVLISFNLKEKRMIQVSYFTCRRMWPEVLAVVRKGSLSRYFPFCNNAVNRALYYTGRLGDEMFTYPQNYDASDLVFHQFQRSKMFTMEQAELCLELGIVNVAEELACEFLSMTDDSPYILKQLALINIVKGQIETARIYLRALSRNLVYGSQARDMLRRLESDPQLESDEHIQYLRSIMMNQDNLYGPYFDVGSWLEELLRGNRHNKMAFEYLMAHYLLNRQLDKFIENLPRLDDFDYKSIPRHYQQAILLYEDKAQKDVDTGQRGIDVEITRQYDKFSKIGQHYNNMEIKQQILAQEFSDTYFFYFTFGYTE